MGLPEDLRGQYAVGRPRLGPAMQGHQASQGGAAGARSPLGEGLCAQPKTQAPTPYSGWHQLMDG